VSGRHKTIVKTHWLTHIALAVRDVEKSFRFYRRVFGLVEVYREDGFIQAQTPGSRDVLVFEEKAKKAGVTGGISHFGFRLTSAEDIEPAASVVRKAGGKILSQGEFVPGAIFVLRRPGRLRGRNLVRAADGGRPGMSWSTMIDPKNAEGPLRDPYA
jgi:catechol 2,3-dioxygenase-like lactoylglutathione lyase family enzyme